MAIIPAPGEGYTLQAQRTAIRVDPGFLPGSAGFDGTDGEPFGEDAEDLHDTTLILFQAVFRGAIEGEILDTPVSLPVREIEYLRSTGAAVPIDPAIEEANLVPRASSLAITDAPLQGDWHNWGDGEHEPSGIVGMLGVTLKTDNASGTPTDDTLSPRHREILYQRFWADAIEAAYVALEKDTARGWLHTSAGTKIKSHRAHSALDAYDSGAILKPSFTSDVHAEVSQWKRMRSLVHHGGRLALLGQTGASAYSIYLSADAGFTIEESLALTNVASCLIDYLAAQGWLIVLWEDATSHLVYTQKSLDGGETWEDAVLCQWLPLGEESLSNMEGTLNDGVGIPQVGGGLAIALVPPSSSTARILTSHDGGEQWRQVL